MNVYVNLQKVRNKDNSVSTYILGVSKTLEGAKDMPYDTQTWEKIGYHTWISQERIIEGRDYWYLIQEEIVLD